MFAIVLLIHMYHDHLRFCVLMVKSMSVVMNVLILLIIIYSIYIALYNALL